MKNDIVACVATVRGTSGIIARGRGAVKVMRSDADVEIEPRIAMETPRHVRDSRQA